MAYERNNPTLTDTGLGGLTVLRLAPGNQHLVVDIAWDGACEGLEARLLRTDSGEIQAFPFPAEARRLTVAPIWNDAEYQLTVHALQGGQEVGRSRTRLVRMGYVPGTVVNYIHPEDHTYMPSGRSPASPSLLRLPDGRLLASHDVYWGKCAQNLTLVFVSKDDGRSWSFQSRVEHCFWGKLFYHRDALYLMGMDGEYGAIHIFRSTDGGVQWTCPVELMRGGDRDIGGPHQGPMPIIEHQGRLWTAIDHGSWSLPNRHGNGLFSAAVDADLMDPQSWTCTGFTAYDPAWTGTVSGRSGGCIEGNAVVAPDGRLFNFLRYGTDGCAPCVGRALILEADASAPEKPLRFHAVVPFPGNMSKFKIGYDARSLRYWSLVSRVTGGNLKQRNVLTLISSPDLFDWRIERDILNYEDNGWPEDSTKVGFQYVDWILDGDDMLVLSRTALNGAHNFHNANYLTFHRIRHFRQRGY